MESLDPLSDLFEHIGQFFERPAANSEASLTEEMVDIVVRIMAKILSILAIATMNFNSG